MDEQENQLIDEITKVCKIKLKVNTSQKSCLSARQNFLEN